MNRKQCNAWIVTGTAALLAAGGFIALPRVLVTRYDDAIAPQEASVRQIPSTVQEVISVDEAAVNSSVQHVATPETVRGLYMSSWVAATPSKRQSIIDIVDTTEINAVVIDIKDATGRVSFLVDDPLVAATGSPQNRIRDIDALIALLHQKGIYVIGRISVFQDPYLAVKYPDWAVRRKSDGGVWKDKKGLSFLSPTSSEVWEYTVALSRASYAIGFDEINFDYIRFPSDGNISDIAYPDDPGKTRADFLEEFFAYLDAAMDETGIPTSADLFGMVTTAQDDLGIGQVLERALPHFDFISPMVYPSHYPPNFIGIKNPASEPYTIVAHAMAQGVQRAQALGYGPEKFRPWVQDFNLGATYTAAMVRDQIRAMENLGIDSWMSWDPANTYTAAAYLTVPASL